jgi:transposase
VQLTDPTQLVVVDECGTHTSMTRRRARAPRGTRGAHTPDRMRALVEAAGCRLVFLPAYSPDLSPVEEAFSKIKTLIKAAGARTRATLDAAIAVALAAVTAGDAAGWFAHAGYPTPQAA